MPSHARVWIYKCGRDLGQAEQKLILEKGAAFTADWSAHGDALDACVDVLLGRFVVIALDEVQAAASGCSIDKSVGFIKDLEHDLNIMLTDRMLVIYEVEGQVSCCRLQELPSLLAEGMIGLGTPVYDDLLTTVGEMNERFKVPLGESWVKRFIQ
ncbi:MAG: hypothetical protein KDB88_02940 [Flavobacteriales bacterium]|nr:hypothetical protein [Flavobacteriales bacterium]